MATKISRRNLFRLRPSEFAHLFREEGRSQQEGTQEPIGYFRPPGAASDEPSFLSTCERCHACAKACPAQAIDVLGAVAGTAEGTPVMHPEKFPCHWCVDMPCIEACPSGALSRHPDSPVPPIGKAVIDLTTCLNNQGVLCESCALFCPPHIRAITMTNHQPILDEERCTGCGLCAYHCDSMPGSIHIRPC